MALAETRQASLKAATDKQPPFLMQAISLRSIKVVGNNLLMNAKVAKPLDMTKIESTDSPRRPLAKFVTIKGN